MAGFVSVKKGVVGLAVNDVGEGYYVWWWVSPGDRCGSRWDHSQKNVNKVLECVDQCSELIIVFNVVTVRG